MMKTISLPNTIHIKIIQFVKSNGLNVLKPLALVNWNYFRWVHDVASSNILHTDWGRLTTRLTPYLSKYYIPHVSELILTEHSFSPLDHTPPPLPPPPPSLYSSSTSPPSLPMVIPPMVTPRVSTPDFDYSIYKHTWRYIKTLGVSIGPCSMESNIIGLVNTILQSTVLLQRIQLYVYEFSVNAWWVYNQLHSLITEYNNQNDGVLQVEIIERFCYQLERRKQMFVDLSRSPYLTSLTINFGTEGVLNHFINSGITFSKVTSLSLVLYNTSQSALDQRFTSIIDQLAKHYPNLSNLEFETKLTEDNGTYLVKYLELPTTKVKSLTLSHQHPKTLEKLSNLKLDYLETSVHPQCYGQFKFQAKRLMARFVLINNREVEFISPDSLTNYITLEVDEESYVGTINYISKSTVIKEFNGLNVSETDYLTYANAIATNNSLESVELCVYNVKNPLHEKVIQILETVSKSKSLSTLQIYDFGQRLRSGFKYGSVIHGFTLISIQKTCLLFKRDI